jgi:hypothetical protein
MLMAKLSARCQLHGLLPGACPLPLSAQDLILELHSSPLHPEYVAALLDACASPSTGVAAAAVRPSLLHDLCTDNRDWGGADTLISDLLREDPSELQRQMRYRCKDGKGCHALKGLFTRDGPVSLAERMLRADPTMAAMEDGLNVPSLLNSYSLNGINLEAYRLLIRYDPDGLAGVVRSDRLPDHGLRGPQGVKLTNMQQELWTVES